MTNIERLKQAAIKCLVEETLSVLNAPPLPINGRHVICIPRERAQEIKRRIEMYEKIALGGK